jgi:hypothetical protein
LGDDEDIEPKLHDDFAPGSRPLTGIRLLSETREEFPSRARPVGMSAQMNFKGTVMGYRVG